MADWNALQHAYGPADDLARLLGDLSPDPEAEVWGALWSRVCHQGTTYSASYPVLPLLLATAEQWPPTGRLMPLALASSIVVGEPLEGQRAKLMRGYEATVARLHSLSLETLNALGWPLSDFVSLLQAILAFEGDVFWGERLDCLLGSEFQGVCPACGVDLYLVVGSYGFFVTAEEWVNRPTTRRIPILPARSSSLEHQGAWLFNQAELAQQSQLASWFLHLFGTSSCPKCGASFSVPTAATAAV